MRTSTREVRSVALHDPLVRPLLDELSHEYWTRYQRVLSAEELRAEMEHYPAQDLLIVRTPDRRRVQLPLVEQLVPEVDLEAGVVLADPPGGLFDELPEDEQGPEPETSAPARTER